MLVGPLGTFGGGVNEFVFGGEGDFTITPEGVAYGIAATNQQGDVFLFTVSLATGTGILGPALSTDVTVPPGESINFDGLQWRSDGKLVALERVSNAFFEIDPTTGTATTISQIAPTLGGTSGLTRDFFITSSGDLYSINLFTGQHALVATGVSGPLSSAIARVPEPDSLSLLGLGLAGVGGFAWARRRQGASRQRSIKDVESLTDPAY